MKNYGIIYKITNKETGLSYIGQTTQSLSARLHKHISDKRNRYISNVINKYDIDQFSITELVSCFDLQSLNESEVFFVNKFNTLHPNGYNHRAGGNQNGICSDTLKTKISKAKTGKPNPKRKGFVMDNGQKKLISRSLGGDYIVSINSQTGLIKIYETVHSTAKDGHNPSNVVTICKKHTNRRKSMGCSFMYFSEYANQSGSLDTKESRHAQRLGGETMNNRLKSPHESPTDVAMTTLNR